MYGMNNSGRLFSDELTNCFIDESWFKQLQCQISIYYNYAPYGSKLVVLSYVDDCIFVELGNIFVDTLQKICHVKFPGYTH